MSSIAGLGLLVVRGLMLWLLLPVACLVWLLGLPVTHGVSLGQFLGWVDLHLVRALQTTLFAWGTRRPVVAPAWADAGSVTHRVRLLDPL